MLLSELAATQDTSDFIFMTSERRRREKNKQNKQKEESMADGSSSRILTVTSRKSNLIFLRLRKSEVILRSKH